MTITAAALISTLASQASSSTNRQSVAAPAVPQRPSLAYTDTAKISPAALASATGGTSPTQSGGTTSASVNSATASQFNFSNMTSKQATTAAGTLYKEGKITGTDMSYLDGLALNSVAVDRSTPESLDSSVTHNYQSLAQQALAAVEAIGPSQQREIDGYKNLLNVLAPYFASSVSTGTGSSINTKA